jgi:cobyric acid synthase
VARTPADLEGADAVVLPGSKNVLSDLTALRQAGMDAALRRLADRRGAEVVGICGGFQMLGATIADPHGVESRAGRVDGLGLLPLTTELAREKTLGRTEATHVASGLPVRGYEIHHGLTSGAGARTVLAGADGAPLGVGAEDDLIWGTYLHGIFDADPFRRWFVDRLRHRRGLAPLGRVVAHYDIEPALDRLADVVRTRLDMEFVYGVLGL